jgi:hypothetical protein
MLPIHNPGSPGDAAATRTSCSMIAASSMMLKFLNNLQNANTIGWLVFKPAQTELDIQDG